MLRAEQVSFRYPQEGRGLKPISLEIVPGEMTLKALRRAGFFAYLAEKR